MAGPTTVPGPVQTKAQALAAAASSQAMVMTSNITTGNTVVLVSGVSASGSYIIRILDGQNNVYSLQASAFLYSGAFTPNGKVFLYTSNNVVGGYSTISLYLSGGTSILATIVREVSGAVAASVANQAVSGYFGKTQPYKSQFITPPQPNVLAFSWMAVKASLAGTASGGYHNLTSQTSLSGASVTIADLVVATPVASSSYWNAAGSRNIQTGLLYLKGQFDDPGNILSCLGCG